MQYKCNINNGSWIALKYHRKFAENICKSREIQSDDKKFKRLEELEY
jgi:hypothetical protein